MWQTSGTTLYSEFINRNKVSVDVSNTSTAQAGLGNKNKVRSGKVVHVGKNFLNIQQELPFKNKMHHTINPSDVVNEEMELEEGAADTSLAKKAEKSGVSLSTLRKVYNRGVAAWNQIS